jgi:hypothetical protein
MPVELHPAFRSRVRIPPELPIGSVVQSVRTERQFHYRLVVTPQEAAAANARWNYSISTSGMLREVRLLTLLALSGTSGTPGFHPILSSRLIERMANAGRTTGSAPAARREVGCSNHSPAPRSGVAQSSVVLPILVASRLNRANACGNTSGTQVVQIHPSIPGSIGLPHRLVAHTWNEWKLEDEWRMQAGLPDRASASSRRKVGCLIHPRPSVGWTVAQ